MRCARLPLPLHLSLGLHTEWWVPALNPPEFPTVPSEANAEVRSWKPLSHSSFVECIRAYRMISADAMLVSCVAAVK